MVCAKSSTELDGQIMDGSLAKEGILLYFDVGRCAQETNIYNFEYMGTTAPRGYGTQKPVVVVHGRLKVHQIKMLPHRANPRRVLLCRLY